MRIHILVNVVFLVLIASCTTTSTATPTPTIPPKQPEPGRPLIKGEILGIPDDMLVTIHVHTPTGREVLWGTQRGSGPWEAVVTEAGGADYVVTVGAEGYVSEPISYTIHLSGTTAYLVEDDQITSNEALHLNFHFKPAISP